MAVSPIISLPLSRTTRETKEDVVIKGHLIPKGLAVQFPIGYLHRNPEYWPEPEKFKPERYEPFICLIWLLL